MASWYGITYAISNMAFANFNQLENTKKENLPIISGVLINALHCTKYKIFLLLLTHGTQQETYNYVLFNFQIIDISFGLLT